jgi:hypothetical protein
MRYHPPQLPGISNADFTRYRFIVEAAYRLHDLFLGKILEHITPESHAILLSDHGFASGDDRLIQLPGHAGAPALEHRFYGVFAARGPRFKDAEGFTGLSLLDMAPTVLASCGIAPTTSMVGRVPAGLRQYELSAPAELVRQTSQKGTSRPDLEAEMLENLVALGYLDRADTTTQHGRLAENVYYAARSLRAEGKLEGARTMMQPLMELGEVPERYALLMASVLSELQNWPALKVVVKRFGSKQSDLYLWRYFDQLIRLSEGQRLELPIGLNERARGALVVLWGRLLAKAGKWTELDALLEGKPSETPDILNLNMRLALAREQWSEALEYALKSTEILYHQPTVHGALAMLFAKLGMPEQAVVAKAVALKMQPVRAGKPLVVVTGPPRSGTSLAMQLLEAVGIEAVSDGVRSADGHNERGYFEHEKVKQWTLDAAWLEQQSGRAIKIVEPLLVQAPLPDVPIVVIRMDRELNSVMRSQRAMKGNEQVPMGLLERQRWERAKAELIDFADVRGDMQVFHWSYEALMAGEIEQVMGEAMAVLHATLDLDVNWTNLKALIMPELRHF